MTGKPLSRDLFNKMATSAQSLVKIEAFSDIRQLITCFLIAEKARTGLEADHPVVLQACARHFNLGPVPNQCLNTLISEIAVD